MILPLKYGLVSFSKGNCSSCGAVFSVLKKRVRLQAASAAWCCLPELVLTTMSLCCRETAVTVATASVHDAVHTKYPDRTWGRQVRKEIYTQSCENKQSFSTSVVNFSPFLCFFFFFLAPEAQRETVFVCAACSSSLTKPQ